MDTPICPVALMNDICNASPELAALVKARDRGEATLPPALVELIDHADKAIEENPFALQELRYKRELAGMTAQLERAEADAKAARAELAQLTGVVHKADNDGKSHSPALARVIRDGPPGISATASGATSPALQQESPRQAGGYMFNGEVPEIWNTPQLTADTPSQAGNGNHPQPSAPASEDAFGQARTYGSAAQVGGWVAGPGMPDRIQISFAPPAAEASADETPTEVASEWIPLAAASQSPPPQRPSASEPARVEPFSEEAEATSEEVVFGQARTYAARDERETGDRPLASDPATTVTTATLLLAAWFLLRELAQDAGDVVRDWLTWLTGPRPVCVGAHPSLPRIAWPLAAQPFRPDTTRLARGRALAYPPMPAAATLQRAPPC